MKFSDSGKMKSDKKQCFCVTLSLKVKVIEKSKANAIWSNKHITQKQNKQEICPVTGVQLCKISYE